MKTLRQAPFAAHRAGRSTCVRVVAGERRSANRTQWASQEQPKVAEGNGLVMPPKPTVDVQEQVGCATQGSRPSAAQQAISSQGLNQLRSAACNQGCKRPAGHGLQSCPSTRRMQARMGCHERSLRPSLQPHACTSALAAAFSRVL